MAIESSVKIQSQQNGLQNALNEKGKFDKLDNSSHPHYEDSSKNGTCLQQQDSVSNKDTYYWYKMSKQITLVGVWICMGLSGEMSGPTLPDLKDRIGVDYEEISRALVSKSIGLMISSIVGGFLHEIFYRHTDLINALSLILMAFAAILTPWSTSVAMAGFAFFLNGFGEGILNTGGNTMVMHLWGEKSASPMHSLHFGFGFGALLAPQIARPFLSPELGNTTGMTTMSVEEIGDLSRIEIPYSITGLLIFLFSLVIIALYIKGPPKGFPIRKNLTNFREMSSPGSCAAGHTMYGLALFACLFFYFMQAVGGDRVYGKFIFSYAYESNLLDKDAASGLNSLFWLSFTVSRLLGIPLTKFLPLNTVIIGDICLSIFSSTILALFAIDNVNILWSFTVFMGLAIGVVFPNGMSWANLHLAMNSVAVMVLMVGGSCGGFIYQYMGGSLFENYGPETLMYVMVGYSTCVALAYISMVLVSIILNPNKTSYSFDDSHIEMQEDKIVYNEKY